MYLSKKLYIFIYLFIYLCQFQDFESSILDIGTKSENGWFRKIAKKDKKNDFLLSGNQIYHKIIFILFYLYE